MSAHTTDAASPVAYHPGSAEYDEHRAGFQLREQHQPAHVVAARAVGDVVAAVRHAAESCTPIGVQATGHGLANPLAVKVCWCRREGWTVSMSTPVRAPHGWALERGGAT
jgi:FAD/FMN-containing dehydrogenase